MLLCIRSTFGGGAASNAYVSWNDDCYHFERDLSQWSLCNPGGTTRRAAQLHSWDELHLDTDKGKYLKHISQGVWHGAESKPPAAIVCDGQGHLPNTPTFLIQAMRTADCRAIDAEGSPKGVCTCEICAKMPKPYC